ncbi:MAG: phosphoadenosine phosphosulfate reductase family protein [Acidobacteria bacterium]|nr:phosphoadenosine phosphosulfate reductase family protein [Acidobacteriota bacterium]
MSNMPIPTILTAAQEFQLSIDEEVAGMLDTNCVIAIGTSGGKDSDASAIQTIHFLNAINHVGPRVLIHADLGGIEHTDSLPQCEQLASFLNLSLLVVRRKQGGLLERWEQRWNGNLGRYRQLLCVTLITPWSSAGMRFCTSELKTSPITQQLTARYPGQQILNVVGIRREESSARAAKPISQEDPKLKRAAGTSGRSWYPILDWKVGEVIALHEREQFPLHYAYTNNGNSRVSCSFCVLSSIADLEASLRDERNHASWHRIVALEAISGFSFQPNRWLADVRPELLTKSEQEAITTAKHRAVERRQAESIIPQHLRFTQGWPTEQPCLSDCALLASVRQTIASLYNFSIEHTTPESIYAHYQSLLQQKTSRKPRTRQIPVLTQAAPMLPFLDKGPASAQ